MYCMGVSEAEILAFARPALAPSLRRQRRACLPPEWRPQARVYLKPEVPWRPPGTMYGLPYETGIDLRINLGEEWYEIAKRTGLLDVDGYFICCYDSFDELGRPVEVRAVRLVPTMGGEDWMYIPSPATVSWDGDRPSLRWHVTDDDAAWHAHLRG